MVLAALMIAALMVGGVEDRMRVKCVIEKCTLPGCTRSKAFQTWSL